MKQDNINNFPIWKAFDCISIGICVIDFKYNVVFWNEYMELWTSLKKSDIIHTKINKHFKQFDSPFIKDQIDQVMHGWPPFVFSSQLHDPIFFNVASPYTDLIQDIKVSEFIIDDENKYVIISVENLTEINRQMEIRNFLYNEAQNEILLREEAMSKVIESESRLIDLDKMKNQLFSIIGHDLRSPMATIYQLSDLIVKEHGKPDIENIEIIREVSKSTLDLLQNLLDWAKIQMKGITFAPSNLDIQKISTEILNHYSPAAEMKGLSFLNKIPKNAQVFADKNMLHTLLRNLTWNALKYSAKDGIISIKSSSNENEIVISVSDTGIGMDEKTLNNLFIQEKVKSRYGTNNEKGTGLGLMLCKDIMEMHHGKILVESKVNEGTTIKLFFPVK